MPLGPILGRRDRLIERIVLTIMLPSAQVRRARLNRVLVVTQDKRIGALSVPPALKRDGALLNVVVPSLLRLVVPNRYVDLIANLNLVAPYGIEGQVGFHHHFGAGIVRRIRLRRIGVRAPAKELVVCEGHIPSDCCTGPWLVGVDRVRLGSIFERYISSVAVFIDDLLGIVGIVRVVNQPVRCWRHDVYCSGVTRATVSRRNRGHAGLMGRHTAVLINRRHALVRRRPGDARALRCGGRGQLALIAKGDLEGVFGDINGGSRRYLDREILRLPILRYQSRVFMLQGDGSFRNPCNCNGIISSIRQLYLTGAGIHAPLVLRDPTLGLSMYLNRLPNLNRVVRCAGGTNPGGSGSIGLGCDGLVTRGTLFRRGFLTLGRSLALNRARFNLHRQRVGHLIRGDLVLAVGVGGQLGLDAVDDRLDLIDLPALGSLGGELQFFVCGNVDRVGVVVNLVPVLGKGDGGAVSQIQLDGSKLILLDRRRGLGAGISRRLGLGAQNHVGRGVRGGGFGCRIGRRLGGLDHGLFGCLRAVGRRGLVRRSRRLIGHGGVCRLRSGGLHAGVIHRRGDILARLLVGQRAACECRRAHHLRGKQDRQDDRRRLDAEIPPSSQDSTVGLHKTPPTFSAATSRGCPPSGRNASCAPTRGRTSIPAPAHQARARLARRRAFAFRAKTISSIFTTYSGPLYPPKNESGRTGNECAPVSG